MNDSAFEDKVNRDIEKAKKDLATLGNDGVTGLRRKVEPLADSAKQRFSTAVKTIKKDIDHGLSQYNEKVQEVANRVPGNFGKKAAGYPWVTVTMSLLLGLLLGVIFKPGRQPVG